MSVRPAFGARLIKPDGTVENINMDEALTVTKGKNNEDAEYKIAIPGLEPGVILDYFYYIDYFMEEQSLPAIKIDFFKPYPIKDFLVEISSPPSLALEYANYNGAPALKLDNTEGGVNHLSLHMSGIEAIEQTELFFQKHVRCHISTSISSTTPDASAMCQNQPVPEVCALLFRPNCCRT